MLREDTVGAFVAHGRETRRIAEDGPLADLTFALKDLFDLDGVPTGAGNPTWLATHPVPRATAPLVTRLLEAGAILVGKTHTDEIAWSLNGENAHYGTPKNVAAPGRIPGGSSSGSAAAVAAGLVDFAIGTDTGGSVRLPASYCGIFGLRPTHGRVSLEGAVPLAPSYDAAGWFARDPRILARIGDVLLSGEDRLEPRRLLVARDLFDRADEAARGALEEALARIAPRFTVVESVTVAGDEAPAWRDVFRILQSAEAWTCHGEWVTRERPVFGPGVRDRFEAAPKLTSDEIAAAAAKREDIRRRMDSLLEPGTVIAAPSAPGVAPLIGAPEPVLNEFRARAIEMLCPAGHAGLPQVSLPLATVDGCPVGLSLIGQRGSDEALLALAVSIGAAA